MNQSLGQIVLFRYAYSAHRNYVSGVLVIFVLGLVLYATRALPPPMLQQLINYPVVTTGLLPAPSGLGRMISMMLAGRIVRKADLRAVMLLGFCLTIFRLRATPKPLMPR